jgi:hypothetical protein
MIMYIVSISKELNIYGKSLVNFEAIGTFKAQHKGSLGGHDILLIEFI